ncbi:MAG: hypothetical protein M1833_000593 [Piccolia ochrophora]|nr:MAG: hypothetical protein M1833_000593 [Piccolia ochrophora]
MDGIQEQSAVSVWSDSDKILGFKSFSSPSRAAGWGSLDLSVASRVYLMEPQWNPMAEEQALDRVHRIGQTKPVTAIRYIMKGSFEEYILKVQNNKRRLVDLAVSPRALSSMIDGYKDLKQKEGKRTARDDFRDR